MHEYSLLFIEIGRKLADKVPISNAHFKGFMTHKQLLNINFNLIVLNNIPILNANCTQFL